MHGVIKRLLMWLFLSVFFTVSLSGICAAYATVSISSVSFSLHIDESGFVDTSLVDVCVHYVTSSTQQLTVVLASENIPTISPDTMSKVIYMNQITNDGSGTYEFTVSKEKIESAVDGDIDGCELYVQIGGSDIENYAVKKSIFTQGYVSASTPGDADGNGTLDVLDALAICRKCAGYDLDVNMSVCDVDGSGSVNVIDALLICRKLAGYDVEFV